MEITSDNLKSLQVNSICFQGPCLHSIGLELKDGSHVTNGYTHASDVLRLMALAGKRHNALKQHFKDFVDRANADHMEKKPIKLGDKTIVYASGYKPRKITIPAEKPKVPKPQRPDKGDGNKWLEDRGIMWGSRVGLREAKAIFTAIHGRVL